MHLTHVILTLNEAAEIAACVRSLGPADELLLLDSGSSDDTVRRCREASVGLPFRVRTVTRPFQNYADQRNAALELARSDWVLFIDADERSSPEQAVEMALRTQAPDAPAGFWIPRRNVILGHGMHYTGWWPDYQLRLFQTRLGRYDPDRPVHELVELRGEAQHLQAPLLHYNYRTLRQFFTKQQRYALHEARQLQRQGQRFRPRALAGQPLREFVRRYVQLSGWRDGGHGLLLSALMAWYRLEVLRELARLPPRVDTRIQLSPREKR